MAQEPLNFGDRGPGCNQYRSEGMTQRMHIDAPELRAGKGRVEPAFEHVAPMRWRAGRRSRRRKYQVILALRALQLPPLQGASEFGRQRNDASARRGLRFKESRLREFRRLAL